MIRISFTSVQMSFLFANFIIILLYLVFRNQKLMVKLGIPILSIGLGITVLRMFLPFEFVFLSHNVYLPKIPSYLLDYFLGYHHFGNCFSLWTFAVIIWISGTLYLAARYIINECIFASNLKKNCHKLPEHAKAFLIFQKIQEEFPKTRNISLYTLPQVCTPMIYGLLRPYILLPEKLDLDEEQLYFVLRHEASHYLHHDLFLKLFINILSIVYWWNPCTRLLSEQTNSIIEMRVDRSVAKVPSQKVKYLECLLAVAEKIMVSNSSINSCNVISLCSKSPSILTQRFSMLMDDSKDIFYKIKMTLFMCIGIFLFVLSFWFIFEPDCIYTDNNNIGITPTVENSYFIERTDGKYDFYFYEEYCETVDSLEYYDTNIPIYQREVIL